MPLGTQKSSGEKKSNIRWWPAAGILALASIAMIFIWGWWDGPIRQSKVLATMYAQGVALILMLLWLFAFSRLRWRTRVLAGGAIVLALALFAALY